MGEVKLVVLVAITIAVLSGAAIVATSFWSGLLSLYIDFVVFISAGDLTFSLRLGEWYNVNALMSAAFVLAFPTVGCWLSLAGQSIFKDVLAEPQAAG